MYIQQGGDKLALRKCASHLCLWLPLILFSSFGRFWVGPGFLSLLQAGGHRMYMPGGSKPSQMREIFYRGLVTI